MHLQGIPLVFITKDGMISAFNAEFLSRFHSDLSNPGTLLDKPSNKLLNPDPYAFINASDSTPIKESDKEWITNHAFDGINSSVKDKNWLPIEIDYSTGQALWKSSKSPDFLPFRFHTNTFDKDYRITVRFSQQSGSFPVFILNGAPLGKFYWPDLTGYQFGYTENTNFFRIKKAGYIVQEAQTEFSVSTGENEIEITKEGSKISCKLNGITACSFRDSHTLDRIDGLFYIASRDDTEIKFNSIRIESREREAAYSNLENDFSLLNGHDNRYIFFQLLEKSAYIDGRFHYALTLYDVSQVLNKVKLLEREKEQTEMERDRYKILSEEAGLFKTSSFLGDAPSIIKLRETARRAAQSDITILIEGETGTGKTLLASYIHEHSPFSKGPFVVVDCASLPESVLESELFGHVKGAFTGAIKDRIGKFEEAAEGTLFLDEIGNIPLHTQAKLLSFLQNFTIQ
ncbi:MAG: sigma-54 factor interaction domain-containing protein, partial [Fibrobacteres bacterium]|nr:sigma-54 factor interaction domain-containing protein [Fibrobacterota bacterium]